MMGYLQNEAVPPVTASEELLNLRQDAGHMELTTTWFERLYMNLLSYSVILLPIALIVIATRQRILPQKVSSSLLVQWFVYGSAHSSDSNGRPIGISNQPQDGDDKKFLLDDRPHNTRLEKSDAASSRKILDFLWCLIGLQISYLVWGLLQEKIMTSKYPIFAPSAGLHQNLSLEHVDLNQKGSESPLRIFSNATETRKRHMFVTFHDSQFLVFVNRIVAFVTAILALVYTTQRNNRQYKERYLKQNQSLSHMLETRESAKSPSAPLYKYIYCSLSNILSSWCQYEALKFVNFPTQCLSKSCKVIPVMLMSKILLRKRYSKLDYICALLLAIGMFTFMLNQPLAAKKSVRHHDNTGSKSPELHNYDKSPLISGLVILTLYLTFDSFTSNWQQALYSEYNISNWQMMAAINFYSILLTLTSLHQLGNLEPAFKLLASSSLLLRDCILMSLMSSIGQMFVYHTIKRFGSVIFAVIMTLRQFFSIILSCTIYGHRLTFESLMSLMLVFFVVGFQVWHKSRKKTTRSPKQQENHFSGTASLETVGRTLKQ